MSELLGTETESIDRLYLELSQFTKARTKRELQLEQLLYAVERKFPGETRFETALRYICEAEARSKESNNAQSSDSETGENLHEVVYAFRDIAYALQSLSSALSPHGKEQEINLLLVSAHEAIDRAAHRLLGRDQIGERNGASKTARDI